MPSPFDWKSEVRDSIFASDPDFRPCGKQKKSHSQIQTEVIARQMKKTGKNPGTLTGIGQKPKA